MSFRNTIHSFRKLVSFHPLPEMLKIRVNKILILQVVLHGCEMSYLNLWEERECKHIQTKRSGRYLDIKITT